MNLYRILIRVIRRIVVLGIRGYSSVLSSGQSISIKFTSPSSLIVLATIGTINNKEYTSNTC